MILLSSYASARLRGRGARGTGAQCCDKRQPEKTRMISVHKLTAALSFGPGIRCLLGLAFAIAAISTTQAQTGGEAIYGVTTLDVAPTATSQGVALLKAYRDAARKQSGNTGITL